MEDQNSSRPLYDYTSGLRLTLKTWPVIAAATIGLCYLTQTVAGWFGIELPDQANIDLVRRCAGWNWTFAFLCLQVLVLMPAVEEFVFRCLLFRLPARWAGKSERGSGLLTAFAKTTPWAIFSSGLFSAAHYLAQPWPDAAFLALFFFGLAQCWLYRKTDRIWCAILNHALFNLTNLVLLFILPQS